MKVTVKIEGLDDLRAKFAQTRMGTDAVLGTAVLAGAEVVRQAAERDAPGPHIEMELEHSGGHKAEAIIGPDDEHWYYMYAETGTVGHGIEPLSKEALSWPGIGHAVGSVWHPGRAAEPFLRPAIDSNHGRILDAIGRVLRSVIG